MMNAVNCKYRQKMIQTIFFYFFTELMLKLILIDFTQDYFKIFYFKL
jgi:hypothetical protein